MTVVANDRPVICDSHVHLWSLASRFHKWPGADLADIHRDFGLADLAALPLDRAVLVQAQPDPRETDWLLDIGARAPNVAGVVGWTALDAADAPDAIARLAARPGLLGLRPMLQDMPDARWILRREQDAAIEAMVTHDLCFDALVQPRHLPAIHLLARRWPDLRIVIDHAAKPDPVNGDLDRWRLDMAELAALPNVWCKLSGLLTELPAPASDVLLSGCMDHVIGVFPDRLMWGSDWPVLLLSGWNYSDWLDHSLRFIQDRAPERVQGIFRSSAESFYGL